MNKVAWENSIVKKTVSTLAFYFKFCSAPYYYSAPYFYLNLNYFPFPTIIPTPTLIRDLIVTIGRYIFSCNITHDTILKNHPRQNRAWKSMFFMGVGLDRESELAVKAADSQLKDMSPWFFGVRSRESESTPKSCGRNSPFGDFLMDRCLHDS